MRNNECLFPDEWYSWIPFNWRLLSPQAIILANDAEKSNNIICLFYRKPNQPVLIINAFWFYIFVAHCNMLHAIAFHGIQFILKISQRSVNCVSEMRPESIFGWLQCGIIGEWFLMSAVSSSRIFLKMCMKLKSDINRIVNN